MDSFSFTLVIPSSKLFLILLEGLKEETEEVRQLAFWKLIQHCHQKNHRPFFLVYFSFF